MNWHRRGTNAVMAVVTAAFATWAGTALAISSNQVDDFQNGTVQGWGSGAGMTTASNLPDAGPGGSGDYALEVDAQSRFVVLNESQWTGNWTGENVAQISLDVLNTSSFELTLRLGIAGPGGIFAGGGGDTYVTTAGLSVPDDGNWHSLAFDVTPAAFSSIGGSDVVATLQDVHQLRVLHNSSLSFIGETGGGTMLLDNIRAAVPEPTSLMLMVMVPASFCMMRPVRRRTHLPFV